MNNVTSAKQADMNRDHEDVVITLKYSGEDVVDGTMSIEDIVPALQGFSSIYGKIASSKDSSYQHKLRVTGVQQGSFEILLAVWQAAGLASTNLQGITSAASIAKSTIKTIFGLINLTKHVEGKPYDPMPTPGLANTISIKNSLNSTIEVPINIYQYFQEGTYRSDLTKITKPLEENKIDSAEIKAKFPDEEMAEQISLVEKGYFDSNEAIATKTGMTWITGKINTMTKTTNKGTLYLPNGNRVSFKLAGGHPENMYKYFAHTGLVKVLCEAELDDNLVPVNLDVFEIREIQTSIELTIPEETEDDSA